MKQIGGSYKVVVMIIDFLEEKKNVVNTAYIPGCVIIHYLFENHENMSLFRLRSVLILFSDVSSYSE